jgi:hypothetical protein
MSHREEHARVDTLMAEALVVVRELEREKPFEKFELAAMSIKLRNAVTDLGVTQARHVDRNAICANIESAALEYGTAVLGQHEAMIIEAIRIPLLRRSIDLAEYDSTIHVPAKEM